MSKVLVDRELLLQLFRCWDCGLEVDNELAQLRIAAAQPAEAEGADVRKIVVDSLVGMIAGVTRMIPPADQPLPDFIQAPVDRAVERINAALSAVTAERDRLRKDAERYRWASSGVHEAETLVSIVNCHGGYAEKVAERVDVYREAAISAQQSAPDRVSVQVKLLRGISFWLERTNEKSDEDIAELIELRALLTSHGRGEA